MPLSEVEAVLRALRTGRVAIVADDDGRGGDAVVAAALATPESVAWILDRSHGAVRAPMSAALADRLDLPPADREHPEDQGPSATTGTGEPDAARLAGALNALAGSGADAAAIARTAGVGALRAVEGGADRRPGRVEVAVDLMRLAGLAPVAATGALAAPDGTAARLPQLLELGEREEVPVTTVGIVLRHLAAHPLLPDAAAAAPRVRREAETDLRTVHGVFRARAYRDLLTGDEHVALVVDGRGAGGVPTVRVHSECLTGEAFGSLQCECGPQLQAALATVQREGGAVVYLRGQEGRGVGLVDKLRAYRLQEDGLDTLDANLALGLPADAREYGAAAAILEDLGFHGVRLLTNNPDKIAQLQQHGVEVVERVPLVVGVTPTNERYLATKQERMGHLIDRPQAIRGTADGRRTG